MLAAIRIVTEGSPVFVRLDARGGAFDDAAEVRARPGGVGVDAVEAELRALSAKTPAMPATVIAERIGGRRGMTALRDRVAKLRPSTWSWRTLSERCMSAGYSRWVLARMIPSEQTRDVLSGHRW